MIVLHRIIEIEIEKKEINDYSYLYNIVTNTIYRIKNLEKPANFIYNGIYIEDQAKIIFMDEKINLKNNLDYILLI